MRRWESIVCVDAYDLELAPLFPWALDEFRDDCFPNARASVLSVSLSVLKNVAQIYCAVEVIRDEWADVLALLTLAATVTELALVASRRVAALRSGAAKTAQAPESKGTAKATGVQTMALPWDAGERRLVGAMRRLSTRLRGGGVDEKDRASSTTSSGDFELHENPISASRRAT